MSERAEDVFMPGQRSRSYLTSSGKCLRAAVVAVAVITRLLSASCASVAATGDGVQGADQVDPFAGVSGEQLHAQGEAMARAGDLLRAEEYLSAALQRGYAPDRVLPLLLKVCLASSRLSAALTYARPYLQQHPEDYHLRYLVAAVQLGMARHEEAARELQRVLSQHPDFAPAHYLMGVVLRDYAHDPVRATQHFRQHQSLDPDGLHSAEVAAWLQETAGEQPAANPAEPAQPVGPTDAKPPLSGGTAP
jgi:tetratricopeptide (TPR) repeat protein